MTLLADLASWLGSLAWLAGLAGWLVCLAWFPRDPRGTLRAGVQSPSIKKPSKNSLGKPRQGKIDLFHLPNIGISPLPSYALALPSTRCLDFSQSQLGLLWRSGPNPRIDFR